MTHIVGGVKTQGWVQINDIVFETQLSLTVLNRARTVYQGEKLMFIERTCL